MVGVDMLQMQRASDGQLSSEEEKGDSILGG